MNWLDTETKSILQKLHDPKLAPPKTPEFALVLLSDASDHRRLVRAIERINECAESQASDLAMQRAPVTVNWDLTEEDALFGQFELICCDAISIFVRSQVLSGNNGYYLKALFQNASASAEFKSTRATIAEIPPTESGEKFIDQFLGDASVRGRLPLTLNAPMKKARIMAHWASLIGGQMRIVL